MSIDPSGQNSDQASADALIENEIASARAGDVAAGRELLRRISLGLGSGDLHPLLAQYHADCLWNHLHLGVSLERAMHVYRYQARPTAYDPIELAAVFELLVEFANMKKGTARSWIKEHIGAGKQTTENASAAVNIKALDSFEDEGADQADSGTYRRARYLDLLLHTAGSMRRVVSDALELT